MVSDRSLIKAPKLRTWGTIFLIGASMQALAWDVRTDEDAMTGKKVVSASVLSQNGHWFAFPYNDQEQRAFLSVRRHPRFGTDVIFHITGGQLLCRADACFVLVRFDDKPPVKFTALESADNDPKFVFIENTKRFIEEVKKAKRVRVAASVYRQGEPMFEFDVAGYPSK